MSSSAKGAQRCGAVQTRLAALGYRTARISASGQRRGARRTERGLDGDLIALAPAESQWPHLVLEVGGVGKRVDASLREMLEHGPLPPGFIAVVVRFVGGRGRAARWRWYAAGATHDSLAAMLEGVRAS